MGDGGNLMCAKCSTEHPEDAACPAPAPEPEPTPEPTPEPEPKEDVPPWQSRLDALEKTVKDLTTSKPEPKPKPKPKAEPVTVEVTETPPAPKAATRRRKTLRLWGSRT